MAYTYKYERPAVTVDAVVFGFLPSEKMLSVLLIERGDEPFKGNWALPGGFVHMNETLDSACSRELEEETGMKDVFLEQLYTFGEPKRDPRDRVISVAYYALVSPDNYLLNAGTDAKNTGWFSLDKLPKLAFDHDKIVKCAIERLKGKIRYRPIGFELLPEKFTLSQLQLLYETILESKLDKRNFRKKILGLDFLDELDEVEENVAHRAARLYRFNRGKYLSLVEKGFDYII